MTSEAGQNQATQDLDMHIQAHRHTHTKASSYLSSLMQQKQQNKQSCTPKRSIKVLLQFKVALPMNSFFKIIAFDHLKMVDTLQIKNKDHYIWLQGERVGHLLLPLS